MICKYETIIYFIRFTWYKSKRQADLKKHGVDFAGAGQVFAGPTFTFEDARQSCGERRWVARDCWVEKS